MNLGVDIDGVLADDDTYRVDHIAKFAMSTDYQKWKIRMPMSKNVIGQKKS